MAAGAGMVRRKAESGIDDFGAYSLLRGRVLPASLARDRRDAVSGLVAERIPCA